MKLVAAQKLTAEMAGLIRSKLNGDFEIEFIADKSEKTRRPILESADVLIAMNFRRDIREDEIRLLSNTKLIQITLAGADIIPYAELPPGIIVCSNGGAFSESIAEHSIGMMLALARNFLPLHRGLSEGSFDQKTRHKMLAGSTLGIIGFGGIGKETAKLARGLGMQIKAINSSGTTDQDVDFIGTLDDLEKILTDSDFLLLSIGLNRHTRGLIGKRELELMKCDAVLINVARGDLVDEKSLYEHLKSHPQFKAGIEAWWVEPFNGPVFEVHYPFFELDNVLGSPHNSYLTEGAYLNALDRALENVLRLAHGEPLKNVQRRSDYI